MVVATAGEHDGPTVSAEELARRRGRSLPPAADRFAELTRAVCAERLSQPEG